MKSTRPGDVVHRQNWPSEPWIESPGTLELGEPGKAGDTEGGEREGEKANSR